MTIDQLLARVRELESERNELIVVVREISKLGRQENIDYWHPALVAARIASRMRVE